MKKTASTFALYSLCCLQSLVAQVGFGTSNPDLSSVVDFKADDKGILIPRVVLTDLKNPKIKGNVGADAEDGLLVYHSDDKDFPEGFYYWDEDNKTWAKISSGEKKSFEKSTRILKLEPSHDNAVIKLDAGGSLEIPSDLPDGFQVTILGNESAALINSLVPVHQKNSRLLRLGKNGMMHLIFSKDGSDQPYVRISGDVTVSEDFVTKWEITSANLTAEIQEVAGLSSAYNYDIDWGDGTDPDTGETGGTSHTYAKAGTYLIMIKGDFPAFKAKDDDKTMIKEILNWGNIKWESMEEAFRGLTNMKITALDAPDLSNVSSMKGMFLNCTSLTSIPAGWDLSNVTSTKDMFYECKNLHRIPAGWDLSNVTSMDFMFHGCKKLTSIPAGWNVSEVTNMSNMFKGCTALTSIPAGWNVSKVTNMEHMFRGCTALTSIQSKWDVSKVKNMVGMFRSCTALTSIVGVEDWDVSSLNDMGYLFYDAQQFRGDLRSWRPPIFVTRRRQSSSPCGGGGGGVTLEYIIAAKCEEYIKASQVDNSVSFDNFGDSLRDNYDRRTLRCVCGDKN